jgi:hypothetical protein
VSDEDTTEDKDGNAVDMSEDAETTEATGEDTQADKGDVGIEQPPDIEDEDELETLPPEDGDGEQGKAPDPDEKTPPDE